MRARWQNYRGFIDTGWLSLRPLTLLVGANNVGKTSLYSPLLLLKQTLDSARAQTPLLSQGPLFDAGKYKDFVRDHDLDNDVVFHLDFEKRLDVQAIGPEAVSDESRPRSVEMTFSAGDSNGIRTKLSRFRIWNEEGRVLLTRSLLKNGEYRATGLLVPTSDTLDESTMRQLRRAFRSETPMNFMFTGSSFMRLGSAGRIDSLPKNELKPFQEVFWKAFNALQVQQSLFNEVNEALGRVSYLGPLRALPKRTYPLSVEPPMTVGTEGQNAPELLFRDRFEGNGELLGKVEDFLSSCGYGRIHFQESSDGESFSMFIGGRGGSNLVDSGMGLSQILPLITQSVAARAGSLSIVQQPEIHLNPALQVKLMDHVCRNLQDGRRVLMETHSEHLLLRLRRLVAEGQIDANSVSLLYADKTEEQSQVRRIDLSTLGNINRDAWPRGFFAEQMEDSLILAREQSRRAKLGEE